MRAHPTHGETCSALQRCGCWYIVYYTQPFDDLPSPGHEFAGSPSQIPLGATFLVVFRNVLCGLQ